MSTKKYVPDGVYLACDKGTAPVEFKITNNKKVFLHENPVANTADMVPMVNVKPFGNCSIMNGNPCAPAPIAWQGFEDGIFIGDFNPLLEDSVLPCGVGGKIEIHYSLEDAQAACAEEKMSFWEKVGAAVLVVAAVALIVVTGGMAIAAIGAAVAATGALATGIAVTVATLEVAGCLLTAKALYDYSQDGDEWALFKDVSLGFLFLGVGAAIAKGFKMWKATRVADDVVELGDDALRAGDDVAEQADELNKLDELSKDPQTGASNPKSIDEADAILKAEADGMVQNPRRPDLTKGEPNLDFKVDGPDPYRWADVKTPVNRGNLDKMAEGIGRKIPIQKGGSNDVLHIVDLKNIPSSQKAAFQQSVIDAAGSSDGIQFINNI